MKNVRNSHQSQSSEEPQSYPVPVEIDGDKGGRDGEVVNEGIQLQHEPELVGGSNELKTKQSDETVDVYLYKTDPDEEVDHEEYVECKINLLCCVLSPGDAGLHCITKWFSSDKDLYFNDFPPSTYLEASMK